jgi:hypothetical protein
MPAPDLDGRCCHLELLGDFGEGQLAGLAEAIVTAFELIVSAKTGDDPAGKRESFSGTEASLVQDPSKLADRVIVQQPIDFGDDFRVGPTGFPSA